MKPYPNHRQREALQILMSGDWMPLLKLIPIGDRLLTTLLQTGWIERSPDMHAGNLYRVTEAGRTAFRTLALLWQIIAIDRRNWIERSRCRGVRGEVA